MPKDAKPVGDSIIAVHHGKLYIHPRQDDWNNLCSQMVVHEAGGPLE